MRDARKLQYAIGRAINQPFSRGLPKDIFGSWSLFAVDYSEFLGFEASRRTFADDSLGFPTIGQTGVFLDD